MNKSRHQTQLPSVSSGRAGCVPVSGRSDAAIHGGLTETLLAAAPRGDELIAELLGAFVRNARSRVMTLATVIVPNRGPIRDIDASVTEERARSPQARYQDKLLAANNQKYKTTHD